jgi:hypothetical protein
MVSLLHMSRDPSETLHVTNTWQPEEHLLLYFGQTSRRSLIERSVSRYTLNAKSRLFDTQQSDDGSIEKCKHNGAVLAQTAAGARLREEVTRRFVSASNRRMQQCMFFVFFGYYCCSYFLFFFISVKCRLHALFLFCNVRFVSRLIRQN